MIFGVFQQKFLSEKNKGENQFSFFKKKFPSKFFIEGNQFKNVQIWYDTSGPSYDSNSDPS